MVPHRRHHQPTPLTIPLLLPTPCHTLCPRTCFAMDFTPRVRFFTPSPSSFSTTTALRNGRATPASARKIPLDSSAAAARIQAAYRSHVVRGLFKKISAVRAETDRLQRLIQRQETVDALRSDQRQRLRINEELMRQLLKLDSVPGVDPVVREARRGMTRRIVELQEIVDGICSSKAAGMEMSGWTGECSGEEWRNWDAVIEEMEADFCRERGGDELERFCAEQLGFRCFQRFLRESS